MSNNPGINQRAPRKPISLQTSKMPFHKKLEGGVNQSTKDMSDFKSSIVSNGSRESGKTSNLENTGSYNFETENSTIKPVTMERKISGANLPSPSPVKPVRTWVRSATIKNQVSFNQMPGNNPWKKSKKIIPEVKIIEKTVVDLKTFIAPVVTTIVKSKKIKEHHYSKKIDFKDVKKQLKEHNVITKYYKPKVSRRVYNDKNQLEEEDKDLTDENSDSSYIKIEFPIDVIQKELVVEPQPIELDPSSKMEVFLEQQYKPINRIQRVESMTFEAIREYFPPNELCDYDPEQDELINNDKKELTEKQKSISTVLKLELNKKVELHDYHKNIYDSDILLILKPSLPDNTERLKFIKKCFSDKIKEIKVEIVEIEEILKVDFEKYRSKEESELGETMNAISVRNQTNFFKNDAEVIFNKIKSFRAVILKTNKNLKDRIMSYKMIIRKIVLNWKDIYQQHSNDTANLDDSITNEDTLKHLDALLEKQEKQHVEKKTSISNIIQRERESVSQQKERESANQHKEKERDSANQQRESVRESVRNSATQQRESVAQQRESVKGTSSLQWLKGKKKIKDSNAQKDSVLGLNAKPGDSGRGLVQQTPQKKLFGIDLKNTQGEEVAPANPNPEPQPSLRKQVVEEKKDRFNFKLANFKKEEEIKEYFTTKLELFEDLLASESTNFEIKREFVQEKNSNKLLARRVFEFSNEIKFYESGLIEYTNKWSTVIKVFPNGFINFCYKNGDIKQISEDGTVTSYFAKNLINQIENYNSGFKISKFRDEHIEQVYYDSFLAIKQDNSDFKLIDFSFGEFQMNFKKGTNKLLLSVDLKTQSTERSGGPRDSGFNSMRNSLKDVKNFQERVSIK